MQEKKNYIEVLFTDYTEDNIKETPQDKKLTEALQALMDALDSRGEAGEPMRELVSDLEYAAMQHGFYAGFRAARGLFTE